MKINEDLWITQKSIEEAGAMVLAGKSEPMTDYEYFKHLRTQVKDPIMAAFYDNIIAHMRRQSWKRAAQKLEYDEEAIG